MTVQDQNEFTYLSLQSVEYYHMKLMVVGFGGRGKSTVLRSLMRQRQPDKSLPTVGVVLKDWQ